MNEEIAEVAAQFDQLLAAALNRKYARLLGPDAELFLQHNTLTNWKLVGFVERYRAAAVYPEDRLGGVVYRLMDTVLQLYYIQEVDLGIYNTLFYDDPAFSEDGDIPPDLLLKRLSFDQNLIGKSRILWERLMQAIYFLGNGRPIDGRSVKGKFFKWVRTESKWAFLEPYESVVEGFDDRFRTPEFHKGSILRKELLGGAAVQPNDLLQLVNRATNAIWQNLNSIVEGGEARLFTDLHMTDWDAAGA
jgi:hypothetical protein